MKTIRLYAFETNSSSCHAITFSKTHGHSIGSITINMFASGYYYANGILSTPEEKADYFSVALGSYLIAKYRKKYNACMSRIGRFRIETECSVDYASSLPFIPSIAMKMISEINGIMDGITKEFKKHNVTVLFSYGTDGFHVNQDISKAMSYVDFMKILSFSGSIDHKSSPDEGYVQTIMLAKLAYRPRTLYDFIFNDSMINCIAW